MARKAPVFKEGDRIAFSAAHLRSTGQIVGAAGRMRGTVTKVCGFVSPSAGVYFTYVADGDDATKGGLSCNFTLVSRIGIDSALAT